MTCVIADGESFLTMKKNWPVRQKFKVLHILSETTSIST